MALLWIESGDQFLERGIFRHASAQSKEAQMNELMKVKTVKGQSVPQPQTTDFQDPQDLNGPWLQDEAEEAADTKAPF